MEAISNAGSVIGVLAKDGIALVAEKKISSKVGLQLVNMQVFDSNDSV